MEDGRTGFSYTTRNLNIAALSCSAPLCLILLYLFIDSKDNFFYHGSGRISFSHAMFWLVSCCGSYFVAQGLVKYTKEIWQKYVPAWLVISFFGSMFFSLSSLAFLYLYEWSQSSSHEENPCMWYPCYPQDAPMFSLESLPTDEQLIFGFWILTLSLFAFTALVSSISSLAARWFPEKKQEETYTFLEL